MAYPWMSYEQAKADPTRYQCHDQFHLGDRSEDQGHRALSTTVERNRLGGRGVRRSSLLGGAPAGLRGVYCPGRAAPSSVPFDYQTPDSSADHWITSPAPLGTRWNMSDLIISLRFSLSGLGPKRWRFQRKKLTHL